MGSPVLSKSWQKNTLFIHHTIHQTLLKLPVNDNDAHFLPAPQVHFLIALFFLTATHKIIT